MWTTCGALDATGQAEAVRSGACTPGDLAEAARRRVAELDPTVGAIVGGLFTEPVGETRVPEDAPFRGVPLLLKDAGQQLAGTPHWIGTAALHAADYRSTHTTALTRRLLGAGFVAIGKTNVPELSSGITTEPAALHPTHNPWAAGLTAGGSSGGSAAAVAAGMVAVATGADGTGSLRYPASACGVPALKPTAGRVPSEVPANGEDPLGIWCDFVLARTIRDLRTIFTLLAAKPTVPRPHSRSLRIGTLRHDPILGLDVHPDCAAAVERAGRLLEGLGHRVEEDQPPQLTHLLHPIADDLAAMVALTRASQTAWLTRQLGRPLCDGDLEPDTLTRLGDAPAPTGQRAAQAADRVREAAARPLSWWNDHDILVTPVMRQPPWPLGERPGIQHAGAFCFPSSLSGQPALSLPLASTHDGIPIGVQLVARHGADEHLLALAADLEAQAPWPTAWRPA